MGGMETGNDTHVISRTMGVKWEVCASALEVISCTPYFGRGF